MASSSLSRTWTYRVFTSFHGPDVRTKFLSHLRKEFSYNGITMFNDQEIERSQIITPALIRAIRGSRISIVLLSKRFASSSWCLDELVEILKCREEVGQIVMTIFYGVSPSDVRKQAGEFGSIFKKRCTGKTKEEIQRWTQALTDVGNIEGDHFQSWDDEAKKIEKIVRDVSDKLNATPCRDFDNMVGLETHLREMESLLHLDDAGVKIVAIFGPAGIGKSTIARFLYSQLSDRFQLTCFVDNLRESHHRGLDEYSLKLRLQGQLLSSMLNQNAMRIRHLGMIKERLHDQKVLMVLDDVSSIIQLEALANETTWFGSGSRIVVTTEDKELLQKHGIKDTYHVGFPSFEQALKILSTYAFRQSYPHTGFENLVERVTELCGQLPLGLRVVGSSLRGKNEEEWEGSIRRLETILDHQDIEEVLRVGYESLNENEKSLFLHIAVFFNSKDGDLVKTMFAGGNLDFEHTLKILVNRSLIDVSTNGEIVMHKLLQQVGLKAVHGEDPWKHRILIDAPEICDVLERAKGTRAVSGISFDISGISELIVSKKAFTRMPNLRFISIYKSRDDGNDILRITEGMELPRGLRLLHWDAYPGKCLPRTFHTECLVELNMPYSQLEYLWKGTQPLTNLKKVDLSFSPHLKELPDVSNASNLETLTLISCESLVAIPPSFARLQKLNELFMTNCINLQVIPADMNLASLEYVNMDGCSRLREFPEISTNIRELDLSETAVGDVPAWIRLCSSLSHFVISCRNLDGITLLPATVVMLILRDSHAERIPCCINALYRLRSFDVSGCTRLASLPELPRSLIYVGAEGCESLETVSCPFSTPYAELRFTNCFKLSQQARRAIILRRSDRSVRSLWALLPGREIPQEFNHRARGDSLTIRIGGNKPLTGSLVCLVVSPKPKQEGEGYIFSILLCRRIVNGDLVKESFYLTDLSKCPTEHLLVFRSDLLIEAPELSREIVFNFSSKFNNFDIIECGAKILSAETNDQGSWIKSRL